MNSSVVMADFDEIVKLPINEPAKRKEKEPNPRVC